MHPAPLVQLRGGCSGACTRTSPRRPATFTSHFTLRGQLAFQGERYFLVFF